MLNRLVILIPSLVLASTIVFSIYLAAPYYLTALYPIIQLFAPNTSVGQAITQTVKDHIPVTNPEDLFNKINQYRTTQGLPTLVNSPDVCSEASTINPGVPQDTVFSLCQNCSHVTLVTITKYAQPNQLLDRLMEESDIIQTLNDPLMTHVCITSGEETLSLLFARYRESTAANNLKPATIVHKPVSPAPANTASTFTEQQLWEALTTYRLSQGVSQLEHDENLCVYARKRVQDQITKMASTEPADYPNPDKYPLDAHAGFAADADSGYAFDVTRVNHLAENLAYYPGAQAAIHIIEWGWDTSTEGHRETQLSNEYSRACISGGEGFYVAIFGS
jgi:uncharacterized protein YkwD